MMESEPTLAAEVLRLCAWLIGLVVVFAPLERLFAVRPHAMLRKEFFNDLGYYFLNSLLPAILLGVPVGALAWAVRRAVPTGFLETMAGLPFWARASIGFVAGEFGYYWGHRWSHELPFLWRFHAIHHSAEEMDFLVNTRAHPIDMAFGRFCMLVPIYLLGLGGPGIAGGADVPVAVVLIGTAWAFFIHANVKWRFGPLEWLVSTPAFHHWHHTRTGPIDRNYASNLPWLDWLFGSLYLPREWPSDYGIRAPMPTALVDQLVHPLFPAVSPSPSQAAAEPVSDPMDGTPVESGARAGA